MKKIFVLSFVIIAFAAGRLFYDNLSSRKLPIKVLFINQIRGTECCQKGSLEFAKRQLDFFTKNNVAATFVLRYDALIDKKFTSLFKQYRSSFFEYGIFLEITPRLAREADVVYQGTDERWYRAQYAYLVGYSKEERKKLIDTVMSAFKRQFGTYPKMTGGWMIDTYSAEYLSDTYGVENHEITREQWGTDGYALYGGSILSSYIPSKNWLFTPAGTQENSSRLHILRQTLSDPVRNYGDLTSGYTSQPNDYGRTKNFDYFKHLIKQVADYSQPVAILGLENSLDKKYQDEYEKQIKYVLSVIDKDGAILPKDIPETKKINYLSGVDYSDRAFRSHWIETPKYRLRLIEKNDQVQITDLRVFDEARKDPYYDVAAGAKTAFWEIPYVFDSSKEGSHKEVDEKTQKWGELFGFFGNKDWIRERTNPVVNEQFLEEINGIVFPSLKKGSPAKMRNDNGVPVLDYMMNNGKKVTLQFYESHFSVSGIESNEYSIKGKIGKNTVLDQKQNDAHDILFTPILRDLALSVGSPVNMDVEIATTTANVDVIYNASKSVIGRNPVRLVLVSKDSGGKPVRIKDIKIAHETGEFESVKIHETEGHLGEFDGMYYVDIVENKPGTMIPILYFNGEKKELNAISFIVDCKKNVKECVMKPMLLVEYIKVKIEDVLNRR